MSKVIIEPLRVARDPRGYLFEPLGSSFEGFHNVHVVFTVPGVVRGNHYHLKGTEVCSVQPAKCGGSPFHRAWHTPSVTMATSPASSLPSIPRYTTRRFPTRLKR